jgi:hydroxyethylthiazole kinase
MSLEKCLENVRAAHPLIHCITNYVTVNDVANILLACGGSPIMADCPDEAEEITAVCGGLCVNIGTLNTATIPSMLLAGKKAGALGHPSVLDPVGAGASRLRTDTALSLLDQVRFTVVRGNMSEIKALERAGAARGVDADVADRVTEENLPAAAEFVRSFAKKHGCVAAVTGAIDLVTDGGKLYAIRSGRPEMSNITGTGCQLSALTAAYVTANPGNALEAAAAAVCLMGLAGEIGYNAMRPGEGNSSYRNHIIDAVCNIDGRTLKSEANCEII